MFSMLLYLLYFPLSMTIIGSWSYNYWTYIFIKPTSSVPLSVELRLDTLSFLFLTLMTFLMPMVVLISIKNMKKNIKFYCFLILGIEVMLIFTFLSLVMLTFFFSFEMMLTLTSLSVSQWGSKLYKISSSFYLFLFTMLGSVFFLTWLIILLLMTASNNCSWDFSMKVNQEMPMTLPFTLALGIKLPMFPFHMWLPEVHSESDSSGSLVLAGMLLKLGNYGLMSFTLTLFPIGSCYWSLFIFLLATFGSMLGSTNSLTMVDIKQMMAYSSITHMNLAMAGLYSLTV